MAVPDSRASSGRVGLASRPPVPWTVQVPGCGDKRRPAGSGAPGRPAPSTRAPSSARAAAMASASSLPAAPWRWLLPSARAAHSRARLVTLLLAGAARRMATGDRKSVV